MIDFEKWWHETGSGIIPLSNHDQEEHAMRVSQAAWEAASEQLRNERDEARREVCKAESSGRIGRRCAPQEYAKLMGWDCYGGSLIHE